MNAERLIALGLPLTARIGSPIGYARRQELMRHGQKVADALLDYARAAHARIEAIEDDAE